MLIINCERLQDCANIRKELYIRIINIKIVIVYIDITNR